MRKDQLKDVSVLILAAGRGTRMKSALPKVLHEVNGKPLVSHVLDTVRSVGMRQLFVIVGYREHLVREVLDKEINVVRQPAQLGTAHAVLCAKSALKKRKGLILVLPGDAPCVRKETIRQLIQSHVGLGAQATILTACVASPLGYGRILKKMGSVVGIREELDASEAERKINEINSGIYVFDAALLYEHLTKVGTGNRKKEYYLTDVIQSFVNADLRVESFQTNCEDEILGINTRADISKAEKILNQREIERHRARGVTVLSPENTFIASGVEIGMDSVIYPCTWIERNVVIGKNCSIGPFAKIREKSKIDDGGIVGSFVEINRSRIGKNIRMKHLAYLGDAVVGDNVNIGAGVVTANFDGKNKYQTMIEKNAFIGSNTVLIAPVRIGKKARTGAGAVVTRGSHVAAGKTVAGVPARLIHSRKTTKN